MRTRAFHRAQTALLSILTITAIALITACGSATAQAAATTARSSSATTATGSSATTATGSSATTATSTCCTVSVNGPALTLKVTTPGKSTRATFHGSVGQRITVVITNPVSSDSGCQTLSLSDPHGTPAGNSPQTSCGNASAVAIGPFELTVGGTYTARLQFDSTATGHGTLWVSAPIGVGTAAVNGPSTAMNITRVGQGVQRTFTGTAGQRVTVVITNPVSSDSGCQTLTLLDPSGAPAGNSPQTSCGNTNAVAIGPFELTVSGTYTARLEVDPTATGHGTLWVSAPVTVGTVSVNGPARPMNVTRVGQGVQRTFAGKAGQNITVVISNPVTSDSGCQTLTVLLDPSGTPVGNSPQTSCGNGNSVAVTATLTHTGTYTVRFEVDPTATGNGSLTVST